ncbi:TlpA family protein disulfide reductase [Rhodosalinus sp. 5P4]|uniref:TlpA family protein disulfide reductase n=1 Tax=Rhodosalinus sp. 5P4 TaxID=3239196 RepID=UPI0035246FA3
MRLSTLALYTALALGANAAAAADTDALRALAEGDMKKLAFATEAKPAPETAFETAEGAARSLADYRGKHLVVNFWATWCAPCRKEMPQLSELQSEFGGEDFEVVTIATGRNALPAMRNFFEEIGVDNLPLHRDPRQALAREMGVFGLPITVILDPQGREIARLQGDADWASESAKAIVAALLPGAG